MSESPIVQLVFHGYLLDIAKQKLWHKFDDKTLQRKVYNRRKIYIGRNERRQYGSTELIRRKDSFAVIKGEIKSMCKLHAKITQIEAKEPTKKRLHLQ